MREHIIPRLIQIKYSIVDEGLKKKLVIDIRKLKETIIELEKEEVIERVKYELRVRAAKDKFEKQEEIKKVINTNENNPPTSLMTAELIKKCVTQTKPKTTPEPDLQKSKALYFLHQPDSQIPDPQEIASGHEANQMTLDNGKTSQRSSSSMSSARENMVDCLKSMNPHTDIKPAHQISDMSRPSMQAAGGRLRESRPTCLNLAMKTVENQIKFNQSSRPMADGQVFGRRQGESQVAQVLSVQHKIEGEKEKIVNEIEDENFELKRISERRSYHDVSEINDKHSSQMLTPEKPISLKDKDCEYKATSGNQYKAVLIKFEYISESTTLSKHRSKTSYMPIESKHLDYISDSESPTLEILYAAENTHKRRWPHINRDPLHTPTLDKSRIPTVLELDIDIRHDRVIGLLKYDLKFNKREVRTYKANMTKNSTRHQ